MNWKDHLPESLQAFLPELVDTERPCIRLQFHAAPPERRWSSALGRIMFWPQDRDWPLDENGRPLFGLLQINLAEFPHLPGWPAFGILQFFITDDAFWGANPLHPLQQDNFRVIYHALERPDQVAMLSDFSFLPLYEDLPLHRDICYAISGKSDTMPMPPQDHRFEAILQPIFSRFGDQQWEVLKAYRELAGTIGHRLGGYASFAQDDPRVGTQENWELLLQLDTDPKFGLLWGDYGVAHWFFQEQAEQPFDQIWYEWESA